MADRDSNGRINVLFVIMQMGMGGSERLVHNLALHMDRGAFNPSIAWFKGDRALKDFEDLGVPLYRIPKKDGFDFQAMRRLAGIIREHRIDIVNAQHFMPTVYSYYGSKTTKAKRLLYTVHSEWELDRIPPGWAGIGKYLFRGIDFIGVTAKVSAAARKKFNLDPARVHTIRNGVDLNAFSKNGKRRLLRKSLGLNEEEMVIGMVANFKSVKNHIFLLKAFRELVKLKSEARLLLVGQGFKGDDDNTEEEIRGFIAQNGLGSKTVILGYRKDVPELLQAMDIFCLTSQKEGLPISLIEAMASGLAVVGTDVEGIRDVILHDRNGLLVESGGVDGLKAALQSLIENDLLRQRFARESRRLATDDYSLTRCVDEYQDLFLSITGASRPGREASFEKPATPPTEQQ